MRFVCLESFNRTIVELKLTGITRASIYRLTFNRTIVELKYRKSKKIKNI